MSKTHVTEYLLWCAHEHLKFRLPELEAIASLFNIKLNWIEEPLNEPYLLLKLPSEDDARKLMSRSVLCRSLFELWSHSTDHEDLHNKVKALPQEFLEPYSKPDQSFKIQIESFGKKLSRETKLKKIEEFDYLPFEGPIQLDEPDHSFHLIEYYGLQQNAVPEKPYRIFFGRWICNGQRPMINKFALKERKFIGNTSMDPTLSLIMANMAHVQENNLVLDPFVGSGSLLVAAAHFGGYVMGTDIDYLMLHGKAKASRYQQKKRAPDESVEANLKQYGLQHKYIDVLVADASLPIWRQRSLVDAIITDPPYGIREATEKVGTNKNYRIPAELVSSHIPSKVTYNLQDIVSDLLNLGASCLTLGGRLVYWIPVYKEDLKKTFIPSHPCLQTVSYCEQALTKHSSRYLITMMKVEEPESVDDVLGAAVPEATRHFRNKYFQAVQKKSKNSHQNG